MSGGTTSDIKAQLRKLRHDQGSLDQRVKCLEDALEYPLHPSGTEGTLEPRVTKIEEKINSLTSEQAKEQQTTAKLDGALPKITSAITKMHMSIEELQEEVWKLKGEKGDEVHQPGTVEGWEVDEDEEDESFASASEVALEKGVKKEDKLKPMDHGGKKDRIVGTVFEEIDHGNYVEYRKVSQTLRKD